jgi:hypothetical protein
MVKSFFCKTKILFSFFCILFLLLINPSQSLNNKNTNKNIELNDKIDEKLENLIGYYKKLIDISEKKNPEEVISGNNTIAFIQNSLSDGESTPQTFEPFIWTELKVKNASPAIRRGHSSVLADTFMVMFGGCYMESTCYNDVHFLDILSNVWIPVQTTGSIPTARQGHSAALYGSTMWVYGGSSNDGYLNDLYSLNLETVNFY